MPEDQSQLFRERVNIENDSGFVKPPRPPRPEGLMIDPKSFDLKPDFLDKFGAEMPVEPGAVDVEKEGFTVEDVEVGALDDALRRIRSHQTDQQVRELIDEAKQLMKADNYSGALEVLEQARTIAPEDGTVFYLIGFCHFVLGNFEAAYDELGTAMIFLDDAESIAAAAMLRAACLRALVKEIGARVTELKKRGRFKEALALVEENLIRYPTSITLLYQRCELLLLLGLAEQAKQAAQDGIERGGEENAPLFRRMFEQATLLEYRWLLEPVRRALRADDAPGATKQLKSAHSTLKGQQFYEAVCIYTREKGRPSGGGLSIFSRPREQAVSLPSEPLQKLLRWLLSEELDGAHNAFGQGDYAGAINQLKDASSIDSRCSHVNYLRGLALYRAFLLLINDENQSLDLEKSAKDLKAAIGYVREAAADSTLTDQSRELIAAITSYYEQVNKLVSEERAIVDLLKKYNNQLDRLEKTGIGTTQDWQSARDQMLRFKQQAETLIASCSEGQGRAFLQKLMLSLDSSIQGLDRIRHEVEKYSPIHEVLNDYQKMMEGFRGGLVSPYMLESTKQRVQGLLYKLIIARHSLGIDASADIRKTGVTDYRDYINNWQPDNSSGPFGGPTRPPNVKEGMWDLLIKLETALTNLQNTLNNARRY